MCIFLFIFFLTVLLAWRLSGSTADYFDVPSSFQNVIRRETLVVTKLDIYRDEKGDFIPVSARD